MIKIDNIIGDGTGFEETRREMPPMTPEEEEIIKHRGILGMKWGKKRGSSGKVAATAPEKRKGVDEAARESQFKAEYANRDRMSTRQLQNRVKRLQAEQQFKELVNKPEQQRQAAAQAAKDKRTKRNKMLVRSALAIYGNLPLGMYGEKGKKMQKSLGPSQKLAKALSSNDLLKNSDILQDALLHAGTKGMTKGVKNTTTEQDDKSLDASIAGLTDELSKTTDPAKRSGLISRINILKQQMKVRQKNASDEGIIMKQSDIVSGWMSVDLHKDGETLQHFGVPGMRRGVRKQIIRSGGRKDIRLVEKQMNAAKMQYTASKKARKVAKTNLSNDRNRLNKKQFKAAKMIQKASKLNLKNTKQASRKKGQALIAKYLDSQKAG